MTPSISPASSPTIGAEPLHAVRPVMLCLDDALAGQHAFAPLCAAAGGIEVQAGLLGPQLRLWARPQMVAALRDLLAGQLPARLGPLLVHLGSGDFHHVSALLIERAARLAPRPFTVVHLDNHPDWVRFGNGIHCGSWVGRVARMAQVDRHITIGVCSDDIRQGWRKGADLALLREGKLLLVPFGRDARDRSRRLAGKDWPTLAAFDDAAAVDHLIGLIRTPGVYLTIDKDVLDPIDAATNWDQGRMRLPFLRALIRRLGRGHRLIGADMCGDASRPVYGGGWGTRLLKRAEAWIDQPRWAPPTPDQARRNEATNIALATDILAWTA